MKRVIVIGCPGSGKSCLSRRLHDKTGIPLHHLDLMNWNADGTPVERELFLERLIDVLCTDSWIVDGNYGSTMERRIKACDTILFLDLPTDVCLDGIRARRGKPRDDILWVETKEDESFVEFVRSYNDTQRPKVIDLLEKYGDKRVIILKSREEIDDFFENLDV